MIEELDRMRHESEPSPVLEVWDDESGNVTAKYRTLAEAVAFPRQMLATSGSRRVRDLAIIEYPTDGSAPVTRLEGAVFLVQHTARA